MEKSENSRIQEDIADEIAQSIGVDLVRRLVLSKLQFGAFSTVDLDEELTEAIGRRTDPKVLERHELFRRLFRRYPEYLACFPGQPFRELLTERYGKPEARHLTVEQLQDLLTYMERAVCEEMAK